MSVLVQLCSLTRHRSFNLVSGLTCFHTKASSWWQTLLPHRVNSVDGSRLMSWWVDQCCLVVVYPPLWKMMEFVNWDDNIPNSNGKIKFMATKPPTRMEWLIVRQTNRAFSETVLLLALSHKRWLCLIYLKVWVPHNSIACFKGKSTRNHRCPH